MQIRSRPAEPSEGWFQIGDAPEQLSRPRRGYGRVSLVADAERDEREGGERFVREPLLERANTAAEAVLSRVLGLRHGALALCTAMLLLVVLLLASRISAAHAGHRAANRRARAAQLAGAAQLHRDRAQIAQLSTELRSSRQKLQAAVPAPHRPHAARRASVHRQHRSQAARHASVQTRHRPRPPQRAKHRSREGGR